MSIDNQKLPTCVLKKISPDDPIAHTYCAGFQLNEWWCNGLAENLMNWIIDYALESESSLINSQNPYTQMKQAAARVYSSKNYEKRGEIGEIIAHAICRTYFNTTAIAPRIHYKSSSNDPIKGFDLVHVRYVDENFEIWLGEAKFYEDRGNALKIAIKSISEHIEQNFLEREKLILGPQVSNNLPHKEKIEEILSSSSSLDELFKHAVFPIFIVANSDAALNNTKSDENYKSEVDFELQNLLSKLKAENIFSQIKLLLIYVPLGSKKKLAEAFDIRLKGFSN